MKTEVLAINRLGRSSFNKILKSVILEDEVKDTVIEFFSMSGIHQMEAPPSSVYLDVLLTLNGGGVLYVNGDNYGINTGSIVRISYGSPYSIRVEKGKEFHFLRIRRFLNHDDIQAIDQNQSEYQTLYLKAISECTVYTEDIKSARTINRMILPEGLVPRFAMGSVETEGPDEVREHSHPMLDQLFLGLSSCNCICYADGEQTILSENMLLHIPLGSRHAVSVSKGNILAYIWMDFFLTLEGEKYMGEQHQMEQ